MGADGADEMLNVYDADARIVGARPRTEAKRSGMAVGAINLLVRDAFGRILLQKRPAGTENGGRWDKSVGGHVSAGEDFDTTAVRESGEELFDDPSSPAVVLARSAGEFEELAAGDLSARVVMHRVGMQLNLRDVRLAEDGGVRNVRYHLGIYEGRTAIPLEGFRPQPSEIETLRYFTPAEVDRLLLRGEMVPNMAFLWLAHGHRLVGR